MNLFKNFQKDSVLAVMISKFGVAFCMMGVIIITSKTLGALGRGQISYYLLIIAMTQVIIEFIGGSAIVNLAPKNKIINLILPTYFATTLISLGLAVFLFFNFNISFNLLINLVISCALMSYTAVNIAIVLGRKKIAFANLLQLFQAFIFLGVVFFVFYVEHLDNFGLYFNLLSGTYFLIFLLSIVGLKQVKRENDFSVFQFKKELFVLGFWSQCSQMVNILNYRISYFFVENNYGMQELGLFSNSMTVGDMMKIPGQAIGQVQHNKIVNHSNPKRYGLKITPRYLFINAFLYLLQGVVIFLIPAYFWIWLLGADFTELKTVLNILVLGFVFLGISTIYSHYFHAINQFRIILYANITGLAVLVSFTYFSLPILGLKGIIWAVVADYFAIMIYLLLAYFFQRRAHKMQHNFKAIFAAFKRLKSI